MQPACAHVPGRFRCSVFTEHGRTVTERRGLSAMEARPGRDGTAPGPGGVKITTGQDRASPETPGPPPRSPLPTDCVRRNHYRSAKRRFGEMSVRAGSRGCLRGEEKRHLNEEERLTLAGSGAGGNRPVLTDGSHRRSQRHASQPREATAALPGGDVEELGIHKPMTVQFTCNPVSLCLEPEERVFVQAELGGKEQKVPTVSRFARIASRTLA